MSLSRAQSLHVIFAYRCQDLPCCLPFPIPHGCLSTNSIQSAVIKGNYAYGGQDSSIGKRPGLQSMECKFESHC